MQFSKWHKWPKTTQMLHKNKALPDVFVEGGQCPADVEQRKGDGDVVDVQRTVAVAPGQPRSWIEHQVRLYQQEEYGLAHPVDLKIP